MSLPDARSVGPAIILVEPQLPENIGMAARAMANFGLSDLRLVAPREGWPNPKAQAAASGALAIVDAARIYPDVPAAMADLRLVLATTARARGMMKQALLPEPAARLLQAGLAAGEGVGILFGRERTGLENDEISLADAIVTFPVDPAFASLNLAQAVLLIAYEWSRVSGTGAVPFAGEPRSPPAPRAALLSFFAFVEGALGAAGFYPPDKKAIMVRNMRDMILRMKPTEQDVRTLRGALRQLTRPRGDRKV